MQQNQYIVFLYLFFYFLHRRKKGWKKRRCRLPGVNPILKTLTEEEKEKSDDACEYLMFTRVSTCMQTKKDFVKFKC